MWERKERMVKEVKKRGKQLGYQKNIEVVGIPLVKITEIQNRFFFFRWTEKERRIAMKAALCTKVQFWSIWQK